MKWKVRTLCKQLGNFYEELFGRFWHFHVSYDPHPIEQYKIIGIINKLTTLDICVTFRLCSCTLKQVEIVTFVYNIYNNLKVQ